MQLFNLEMLEEQTWFFQLLHELEKWLQINLREKKNLILAFIEKIQWCELLRRRREKEDKALFLCDIL